MVTMLLAVQNGDPEAFKSWLDAMSSVEAIEELTKTYGGVQNEEVEAKLVADENGLYQGTSPILHAAKTGNTSMFSAILDAMRARQVILFPYYQQRAFSDRVGGGRGYKWVEGSRFSSKACLGIIPSTHIANQRRYQCQLM